MRDRAKPETVMLHVRSWKEQGWNESEAQGSREAGSFAASWLRRSYLWFPLSFGIYVLLYIVSCECSNYSLPFSAPAFLCLLFSSLLWAWLFRHDPVGSRSVGGGGGGRRSSSSTSSSSSSGRAKMRPKPPVYAEGLVHRSFRAS